MTAKPLRADAARNRQRVLEVAQDVFASEGLAVPIDEIARRAGVGVGTVYRHFPTKEALFQAIVLSRMQRLAAEAKTLVRAPDPGEAFFGFFFRLIEEGAAKRDLMDALAGSGLDVKRAAGAIHTELKTTMARLLRRAQKSGAIRKDVVMEDVMALVTGAFAALGRHPGDAAARKRLAEIVCNGIRAN